MMKHPRLFERLKTGLEDMEHWAAGQKQLKVTRLTVPSPPPDLNAEGIRQIRLSYGMSQAMFARLLNVSSKTVESWEQGLRRPGQAAARLLQIIDNPDVLVSLKRQSRSMEARLFEEMEKLQKTAAVSRKKQHAPTARLEAV